MHPAGDLFRERDGVSCEACHGPSEAWIADHTLHSWRSKSADDKSALGMVDLRDPARQSSLCVSCHVGNGTDRVLTHAMFAAGHPPVRSIDAATSCESLPRHWRFLADKTREKPPAAAEVRFERSRLAIVSAAKALEASMAQLAKETDAPAPARGRPGPTTRGSIARRATTSSSGRAGARSAVTTGRRGVRRWRGRRRRSCGSRSRSS